MIKFLAAHTLWFFLAHPSGLGDFFETRVFHVSATKPVILADIIFR